MSNLLVPLLLWVVVVWRAPKAMDHSNQRPLVIAFFCLAIVTTVRTPQAEDLLRQFDLAVLLTVPKHLAGAVMTAAVLEFVARMLGGSSNPRRDRHIRYAFTVLMVTIMMAALPAIPRTPAGDFLLGVGGSVASLVYWGAWLTHLGTMLALATRLFLRQARQAPGGRLRVGLTLSGTGTTVGLLYVANKLGFMLGSLPGGPGTPLSPDATAMANTVLLNLSLLLVVVGTTLPAPAVGAAIGKARDLRALADLRPLWKEISTQSPDVVLSRDYTPRWNTQLRLYRCAVEIEDGVLALHGSMQADVDDLARKATRQSEMPAAEAEAFIEACRWRVALRAKATGVPGTADEADCATSRSDAEGASEEWLSDEVKRLRRIARAYRSRAVRDLADAFPLPTPELQEPSQL
ncbi:MAB_1171c family putative transporter [Nocardiopsis terrae]